MPPRGWCPVTASLPGPLAGKHMWVYTQAPHWELTLLPRHIWPVDSNDVHITGCRLVTAQACTLCGHEQYSSIPAHNFN